MRWLKHTAAIVALIVVPTGFSIWRGIGPIALAPGGTVSGESSGEAEVLQLDQRIADAVVRGDTEAVYRVTPDDFVMVHGDGWTNGGKPLLTDTKASMLGRVTSQYYDVIRFDSVKAEMHGDVAITYGRYVAHTSSGPDPSKRWFAVWFERVYAKRGGTWIYLSHRTVHGPTYGADRASVQDK